MIDLVECMGAWAVVLLQESEAILIDRGSTTFHMLDSLLNLYLTVITNPYAMAGFSLKAAAVM